MKHLQSAGKLSLKLHHHLQIEMAAPEPWQRQGEGWTRKMYGAEAGFAAFATHKSGEGFGSLSTHATYTSTTPCTPDDFANILGQAWIGVRFNLHLLLAAVSTAPSDVLDVEGYSLFYPDVQQADVDKWARSTVTGHESCTLAELVASLKHFAPTARNHRASIHFAPSLTGNSFHVVLVAGHWLTDGRGAVKILNYILNSVNTRVDVRWRWGEEAARLSIPLPLTTGRRTAKDGQVVPLPTAEVQAILEMLVDAEVASQPTFAHPHHVGDLDRSKPDVIHEICLSPSESKSLLHACRSHGVSVTALLNVLLSMSFVGNPKALSGSKTVAMPFFSTDRGRDLLEEHRGSVGLQLVLFTLGLPSDLIRSYWTSYPDTNSNAIWEAAKESKRRITEALSHDIGLTYEHEIICAILPGLLSGNGVPFYQAALPFATSIGRITELFATDTYQSTPPTWTIDHVANSYTVRWYRPVAHYWEWRSQTTVRIVASVEYDKAHSVLKMKEEMMDQIRRLI